MSKGRGNLYIFIHYQVKASYKVKFKTRFSLLCFSVALLGLIPKVTGPNWSWSPNLVQNDTYIRMFEFANLTYLTNQNTLQFSIFILKNNKKEV